MKPYALWLYQPATLATQTFQAALTNQARGWRRSIRSNGGCWQGSFQLDGDEGALRYWFHNHLGYEIRERAGGMLSWAGMIYEMDLTVNGVTRRRSLDLVANRVKTTYTKIDFSGNNFVDNPSFDDYTATGGAVDNFWNWEENAGTAGTVLRSATVPAGSPSTSSVQLTGDTDGVTPSNTYIKQHMDVTPGARYRLKFRVRGDGGAGGRDNCGWWGLDDPTVALSWLYEPRPTNWTDDDYNNPLTQPYVFTFVGPGEGEVVLWFYAPPTATRVCYFDDVEILEERPSVYETSWRGDEIVDRPAQDKYGVKEEVIHLDDYPQLTSTAYRDTYWSEHAWPWPHPVMAAKRGEARLDVTVAGYCFTANWLYAMTGDGAEHDLDDWLWLLVGTDWGRGPLHGGDVTTAGDCQFIQAGNIEQNEWYGGGAALQVPQLTGIEERPWDVIMELTALGDDQGNPFRSWVGPARYFHYQHIDPAPRYYIRRDGIFDTMAGRSPANPWLMQPAVFRDMTYGGTADEPGSFLDSPKDLYVEEVTMADGWDQAQLTTALFSEYELLVARTERGG